MIPQISQKSAPCCFRVTHKLLSGIIGAALGTILFFSGCVFVTITPELENPFIITVYWNGEPLVPDTESGVLPTKTLGEKGAEIHASVKDEKGNHVVPETFEWYLKGELKYEGVDTIFVENTLDRGTYWIDILVKEGLILSSEHVKFVVE